MTSNELALRPSAEVAALTEESPCPKFDRAVFSALINVHVTAIDPEVPPLEREAARTVQEGALRRLVEKVEAGKWDETLPMPVEVPELEEGPRYVLDSTGTPATFFNRETGELETVTEEEPPPDDTVVKLAHDIMDLTDAQIWDQLQAMTYAERVEWFRSTE